jgi:hypothetical protein
LPNNPNNPSVPATPISPGKPWIPNFPTAPQTVPQTPGFSPTTAAPLLPASNSPAPITPQVVPSIPPGARPVGPQIVPPGTIVPTNPNVTPTPPIVPYTPPGPIDPCKSPNSDPCVSNISDLVKANNTSTLANTAAIGTIVGLLTPVPTPVKVFIKCEGGTAVYGVETVMIPASSIAYVGKLFEKIANTQGESCREREVIAVASVPEWWQLRPEARRPQLIYIYQERKDGAILNSTYPITIPHPNAANKTSATKLPDYIKGNFEGILTLKDNSKVIVHCKDENEVKRLFTAIRAIIDPAYLVGSTSKIGERAGHNGFAERTVSPTKATYFANGVADASNPTKRTKF